MKRILFSGDGSSGDLLPMVLMARAFQDAGYEVCVCGSAEFSQMAIDFDVPFEPYLHNYSALYLDQQRTGYVHNIRANIEHQQKLYQGEYDVLSKIAPDYDVLINFLAEIFTPSAAEAVGIPNLKLFTFPMIVSDKYGPPTGLPFVTENKWFNRLGWKGVTFAARHVFEYNATIDRLRGELGLPPVKDLMANNSRCDHVMIGLYDELLPPCPSWNRADYSYIGPCLPRTEVALSAPLEEFIESGSQPIYIGFGSMRHQNAEALTATLVGAARDAGVRVVLAQATSTIGSSLEGSDDVYVLREYPIPHHVLFPRLRAVVHHGSWITTHLAAQAGVPQLVVPQASDQFMWGDRVMKRGLGPHWVDMNRLTRAKLARGIAELVGTPQFARSARDLGDHVAGIDGARNAVELFGRLRPKLERSR